MNYTIYEVNEYSIGISSNKNIIIILVKNNINNDKYNIRLDKLADCYTNTNCENNISFGLISDIYEFIINCLDKNHFIISNMNFKKVLNNMTMKKMN
jgi:hypothetical protein